MSKFLIRTTEMYRVGSEAEANNLIKEAQEDKQFNLVKYHCEAKIKKSKDSYDEWFRVILVKDFTDEKNPGVQADVSYSIKERDYGSF